MRPTGVMRFALFGAAGFGIGWVVAGLLNVAFGAITFPMFGPGSGPPPGWVTWPPYFAYFIAGALGGAALGLAIGDGKRLVGLAVAGGVGVGLGLFFFFIVAFLFGLGQVGMAMGTGLCEGVALGLIFGDWKRVMLLGLAGMVGLGIGGAVAAALQMPFATYPWAVDFVELWQAPWLLLRNLLVQAMVGIIGGAALGAGLGYFESCKPAEGQRPRVR